MSDDGGFDSDVADEPSGVAAAVRLWGRRTGKAALGSFVAILLVLSLLYVASFHAPAAVDERPVDYDGDPGTALSNATTNLWTDSYRLTLDATTTGPDGTTKPTVEQRLVMNNRAGIYSSTVRSGVLLRNRSYDPARSYGTVGNGHSRRPEGVGSFLSQGSGEWEHDASYRFIPSRNVFERPERLADTAVTVVSNNESTFVARVENRTVARQVAYPRSVSTDGDWTASLTLTVDKRSDRLQEAVFRYRNRTSGEAVRATYDIERGVHPHRPTGLYPPSPEELLFRVDRGIRALEALWPLTAGGWR